jgi:hypothetical protein
MSLLKICPKCSRTYSDTSFSFCLEDGALLSASFDEANHASASAPDDSEVETVLRPTPRVFSASEKPTETTASKDDAQVAEIVEPAILITVNRLYKPDIRPEMLYEITRGIWRIGERRNNAKYAFAVYKGIIREVYEIDSWHSAPRDDSEERKKWIADKGITIEAVTKLRWQFDGRVSEELHHYIGCSTAKYQVQGAQNPIKYVNC